MNDRFVPASRRRLVTLAAAAASALAIGGAQAASPRFQLVDLGAGTAAYAVDARGDVAGGVGGQPAVFHDGAWKRLGPDGVGNGNANDIDVRGGAVYAATGTDGVFRSWRKAPGGAPQAIDVAGLSGGPTARGVSADGAVVGDSGGGVDSRCFLWQAGQSQLLATPGSSCAALAVNDAHQVAGGTSTDFGDYEAFVWQDGNLRLLNTFGGQYSVAYGINQAGYLAGVATTDVGTSRPAYWGPFGLVDIGTPNGAIEGVARALNDRGVIVGSYYDFTEHAFVSHGVRTEDLSSFVDDLQGLFLVDATGVNNAGVIVGNATIGDERHGYMLMPR